MIQIYETALNHAFQMKNREIVKLLMTNNNIDINNEVSQESQMQLS